MTDIMNSEHPDWAIFRQLLYRAVFTPYRRCPGMKSRPLVRSVLAKRFPQIDIPATLAFFEAHGGYCDCEVLLNVT